MSCDRAFRLAKRVATVRMILLLDVICVICVAWVGADKTLHFSGEANSINNSFWTGGSDAYNDAIREHYEPLFESLRKRREVVSGSERDELDSEIKRTEVEYKSKLDSIDRSLF